MKAVALALFLSLPAFAQAGPPPGTHGEPAPAAEPMRRFEWRDAKAGFTFVGPERWAGVVQAVALTHGDGVRFVAAGKTVATLHSEDKKGLSIDEASADRVLSRHGNRVVTFTLGDDAGDLGLSDEELAAAVRWDGAVSGEASR
ncbi:MAG: hypothetical protein GAK28_02231 [Luteibacter sp.]|uniref:hypothetical protein n=1 Tax=Luteibacter sp. TaxID=1886636 RepID=UPI00137F4389|nr:hypothetical protein [Luteibacter sp.]KAF1006911.1 MAG: hypothetical protein GAK28_02231 [Luteibacter sp.]